MHVWRRKCLVGRPVNGSHTDTQTRHGVLRACGCASTCCHSLIHQDRVRSARACMLLFLPLICTPLCFLFECMRFCALCAV